jgi:outer membrane protein OmpA-like peptidoglycan-associated protein
MNRFFALVLVLALAVCGCATPMDKTQQGTLIGAGVGAAVGAGLGQAIGRDSKATLIGAAAGALAGGIAGHAIGSYMDRQEQEMRQSLANVESASIRREQDILAVTFKADVLFDTGSATLKPGGYDEINRVARVLNNYPQTLVRVEGHTDAVGSDSSNQVLSERRAEAVKTALVAQNVDPNRIETIGFGKSKPIATNDTEAGRQLNRRVNILIIPVEG